MSQYNKLSIIQQEGEGQTIEFKEKIRNLDREMVAFANAMGGSIFIGINDNGELTGFKLTNRNLSQIQDIARNCDPAITIQFKKHSDSVLEVVVREGVDKPYSCQSGFYLRNGPNTQKLSRNEIMSFAIGEGKIRFDEQYNSKFVYPKDFNLDLFTNYLKLTHLSPTLTPKDLLINLNIAEKQKEKFLLTNAAILFFAKKPQSFFSEAYITAVRYRGIDRNSIIDRKDMRGDLVSQINEALNFFQRHTEKTIIVSGKARHQELDEYPYEAVREALINAIMHRDYFYDSSHIYMHIYNDRLEIENPGGLFKGLTVDDLGKRSVRRNRLIAELFFRVGFVEMIGSGISRIYSAMKKNMNPSPEIRATNFFQIVLKRRVLPDYEVNLSDRQQRLIHFISGKKSVTKAECAEYLSVSDDTALRELKVLLIHNLIRQAGQGKATHYVSKLK